MTPDCTIIVRSPAELVAVTPYLLGFHPTDSVVVVGLDGRLVCFGVRYDLPPPDRDDAPRIAKIIAAQSAQRVTVIGYGPPTRVTPAVLRLAHALEFLGVRVEDALRVTEGRWWSYLCDDPRCCPAEGTTCQPPNSPVVAEAIFQGQVALPNRAALVAQVAAVTGQARAAMVAATGRARARMVDLYGQDLRRRRGGQSLRRAGREAVREAERRYRSGRSLSDDEVAWLGALLVVAVVNDYALDRSDAQDWRQRLWTDVLRRVEPAYVAAVACLLGFAAWQAGQGPLARVAIDRALQEEPGHRLAQAIDRLLCGGIGPHAVTAFRPPPGAGESAGLRLVGGPGAGLPGAGGSGSGRPLFGRSASGPSGSGPSGSGRSESGRSGAAGPEGRTGGERRLRRSTRRRSL